MGGLKKRIYSIRDIVSDDFIGGLVTFAHDAAAVRWFGDIASASDTVVAKHTPDFELWCIGELCDAPGSLEGCDPLVVITGAAWLAAQAPLSKGGV